MGFDGNGNWSSPFYPVTDRDNGVAILASKFQTLIQSNLKESFENCILRDGTGKPTSNINWNGQKITNLASGTSAADAVNKYQLDQQIATRADVDFSNLTDTAKGLLVPPGALQMAPTTTLEGYLLCNGQAVSRTTYDKLFAVIGTNFGVGDNSTTFNVPDYRGCFLRGLGGASAANFYTKQAMGAPQIVGTFSGNNNMNIATGAFIKTGSGNGGLYDGASSSLPHWDFAASRSNSVYGAANEIRPVNYAVNFFIKY